MFIDKICHSYKIDIKYIESVEKDQTDAKKNLINRIKIQFI
ncbi:hypothetical protein KPC_0238 [Acinetobacter stercoris]|uniref:Uncharacterized protein n=1 Tax=Acinetobacter stercoris TaxID=2126983 RepID=A0A2U3MUE4_9GAMM|nr:hypothetical protein KPC_0238 [Acinetobacter stercoris]